MAQVVVDAVEQAGIALVDVTMAGVVEAVTQEVHGVTPAALLVAGRCGVHGVVDMRVTMCGSK